NCKTMEDLRNRLLKQGIDTLYKYKVQTQEKQGVSFKIEKDCFKGSKIDRKFSLGNLEKILVLQQKLVMNKKQQVPASSLKEITGQFNDSNLPSHEKDLTEDLAKAISKTFDLLLKPESINKDQTY